MKNKAFSRLTDADKARKLDVAIRSHTDNLLSAGQIRALARRLSPGYQYAIAVHPVKREHCGALVNGNVLHIFIPEHLYERN